MLRLDKVIKPWKEAAARLSLHARSVLSRVRCDGILRLPALSIWPAATPTLLPALLPAQRDGGHCAFSQQIRDAVCFRRRSTRPRRPRSGCAAGFYAAVWRQAAALDADPGRRSPWHLLPHARGTAQLSEQGNSCVDFVLDIRGCSAPVSYTHLDVYKRQGLASRELLGLCRS